MNTNKNKGKISKGTKNKTISLNSTNSLKVIRLSGVFRDKVTFPFNKI